MDQTNTLMETDPAINAPVQNKKQFESLYLKYSILAAMKNCPQSMPKSPFKVFIRQQSQKFYLYIESKHPLSAIEPRS